MRIAVAVVVLSGILLAGCVDEQPASEPPTETDADAVVVTDPDTGVAKVVRRVPVGFAAEGSSWTAQEDGTFEFGEQWTNAQEFLAAAGQPATSIHVRDISEHVPKGVPVMLRAEVDADLGHGDLDLWFNVPQDEIWTFRGEAPFGGASWVELLVMHTSDQPVEVVVFYDEPEPVPSFDYLLTVSTTADPDVLVSGVPVSVVVPSGAETLQVRYNGTPDAVWLWGPGDEFLGRFAPDGAVFNHTIERAGEYVVMLPEGAADAEVAVYVAGERSAQPLRFGVLKQDIQQTDPVPVVLNQPTTLTYDVSSPPLQTGLQVIVDQFTNGVTVSLAGPEGELIAESFSDDIPFISTNPQGWLGFTFLTDLGVPGLASGTYTGTFQGEPNGAGEMFAWLVYFTR